MTRESLTQCFRANHLDYSLGSLGRGGDERLPSCDPG